MTNDSWELSELTQACAAGRPLVCFGAGSLARDVLPTSGLLPHIRCFTDNNSALWGAKITIGGREFDIVRPQDMLPGATEDVILVTAADHCGIEAQLETGGFQGTVYSWGRRRLPREEFIAQRYLAPCFAIDKDRLDVRHSPGSFDGVYWQARKRLYASADSVIVPQVIFILSNICTLRCEGCSMLMPSFKTPWQMDAGEALGYIDNFLRGVDECLSFNLVGGETLLYRNLDAVIAHLQAQEKVRRITLSTNCTVIPEEKVLSALQGGKVEVFLSDYGDLVKTAKLIEVFEKNRICFSVVANRQWVDFGTTECRGKSAGTLRLEYSRCWISPTCKALYKDKLFACERAARMFMLGDVYNAANDYAALCEDDTAEAVRRKIKTMLLRETADACNYCNAGSDAPGLIPAGRQPGKPLEMSAYTFVKREDLP